MATTKAAGAQAGGTTPHTPNSGEIVPQDTPDLTAFDPDSVVALLDLMAEGSNARPADWWRAGWAAHERKVEQDANQLTPAQLDALAKLREPFPEDMIEKRPQVNCGACIAVARNQANKDRTCSQHREKVCDVCGSFVSERHVHLDYIGHAQATDKLLEVDPGWNWEPVATTAQGTPLLDPDGGLWIRLTVCGMTRLGYGDATGKRAGTTATKEIIGDAIRNAGMRFGMALDLWSKKDLHMEPPHPAEPFLARIKDATIWISQEWLAGVRREADEAGQLGYEVPGGGGATIADIIDAQIERLQERERSYTEERLKREEARRIEQEQRAAERAAANAQVSRENPTPAGQQQTARQQAVNKFRHKVRDDWDDAVALARHLVDITAAGFGEEGMTGPDNQPYRIGPLVEGRIAELRTPSGTVAAARAAGLDRGDYDEGQGDTG